MPEESQMMYRIKRDVRVDRDVGASADILKKGLAPAGGVVSATENEPFLCRKLASAGLARRLGTFGHICA